MVEARLLNSGEGKAEQTPAAAAAAAAGATSHLLGTVGNLARSIASPHLSSLLFFFSLLCFAYFRMTARKRSTPAFLAFAIAFAAFVLYVTGIYAHSWMEKLQMLPLCILAVTPPIVWAIMLGKFHG